MRRLRAGLLTGLGIGLAVASKFSAAPLLVVPLVAAVLAIWREVQAAQRWRSSQWTAGRSSAPSAAC